MSNIDFLQPVANEVRALVLRGGTFIDVVNLIHARTGTPTYSVGVVLGALKLAFGLPLREFEPVLGCERFGGSLMTPDEADQWFHTMLVERGILQ